MSVLPRGRSHALVLVGYLLLAAAYTWPLLSHAASFIASDPYDPILNASILWWNATVVPFSSAWWNPPFFHPGTGVAAFTEHLTGLGLLASPVVWVTGNPLAAYNLTLFATWPLSAFTVYLLVFFLTKRKEAAVVAGLVYGFSPYRIAELGHLQSLSSYWLPLVLLGLHGYLEHRRRAWLALFGVSWLLQSLSNGYFMLQGGVLIALWLLYFLSRRAVWGRVVPVLLTWALASLPLVPVLLRYYAIHEHYGMRRNMNEALAFSAPAWAWFEVSQFVAAWSPFLPEGKDKLFPGFTAIVLLIAGLAVAAGSARSIDTRTRLERRLRAGAAAVAVLSAIATLSVLWVGPWRATIAGVVVRMGDIHRAMALLLVAGGGWLLLTRSTREALARRSPLFFYAAATGVLGAMCWGPVLRAGQHIVLDPAPYRWLMYLPGFDQLRVPTRFWMLGILTLSVAAGVALTHLVGRRPARHVVAGIAAAGVVADGWLTVFPIAGAPPPWASVEPPGVDAAVIELPLGPNWDAAATYRSMWHRRPVFNGVSGYDPAHYGPLQGGLEARDPGLWSALAAFGPIDAVVDGEQDHDGSWTGYVLAAGGELRLTDGVRRTYRVSPQPLEEPRLGPRIPIVGARASHNGGPLELVVDGRFDDDWEYPHQPDQWIAVDLGGVQPVAGVRLATGVHAHDFPRRLRVELSRDGWHWTSAWEGGTSPHAFLAAVRAPRQSDMPLAFPPQEARFVRLRQLAEHRNLWRVAELSVHGPPQ